MLQKVRLIKIGQADGVESNIPVGFEAKGVIEIEPEIGKRFKCGGFETAEIVGLEGDTIITAKSVYRLEVAAKADIPQHGKENSFFDGIKFDYRQKQIGHAVGMTREEVRVFAEKCASCSALGDGNLAKAIEALLPKMTHKEMIFAIGTFFENSKKDVDHAKASGVDPQEILDLLKKLGDMK